MKIPHWLASNIYARMLRHCRQPLAEPDMFMEKPKLMKQDSLF